MNAPAVEIGNPSSEHDGYHFISKEHSTIRLQKMHALQRQSKLCDIIVHVGEEVYRGHKVVFASQSEYFSDIFDENESGGNCEIHIDDISPASFRSILQFFYTGEIVITMVNIEDLVIASKKFKVEFLEAACGESMTKLLNPSTWFKIISVAGAHYEELYQKCHTYSLEHFEEIAETESFLQLPFCDVKEFIADDDLLVSSDKVVYSAVLNWVKYDLPNRAPNLSELMMCVKLPLIDKTYFMENVTSEPIMRDNCSKLLLEVAEYHLGTKCEELSSRTVPRKHYKELPYIFVTGGKCEGTSTSACEVYNLRTNTWHFFSSMQSVRTLHGVIGFKGLLYAFGGFDKSALSSVEYYDPLKDSWTWSKPLPYERYGHGVCSIDNTIYICGGVKKTNNDYLNNVDKFDPLTGVYMPSSPMKNKRYYFNLAVIDNSIYAIGGSGQGTQSLISMEIFDPREGKWSVGPSMSTPRTQHGVAVLDGYIYTSPAVSGNIWERFDIRRNAWEPILNTSNEQSNLNQRGCLYIPGSSIKSVHKYDPTTLSVIEMPPMLKTRKFIGAVIMDCLEIKHSR